MFAVLLLINVCVVIFNLVVLLPTVWRYGFDWKQLALVCAALACAVGSSVFILMGELV